MIYLLQNEDVLIDVLNCIQFEINHKHLKRDELLCLILDKGICIAKQLRMHDIIDLLIRHDDTIKKYFKTHTREEFIDILQDEDVLIDVLNCIQYEIAGDR